MTKIIVNSLRWWIHDGNKAHEDELRKKESKTVVSIKGMAKTNVHKLTPIRIPILLSWKFFFLSFLIRLDKMSYLRWLLATTCKNIERKKNNRK